MLNNRKVMSKIEAAEKAVDKEILITDSEGGQVKIRWNGEHYALITPDWDDEWEVEGEYSKAIELRDTIAMYLWVEDN